MTFYLKIAKYTQFFVFNIEYNLIYCSEELIRCIYMVYLVLIQGCYQFLSVYIYTKYSFW